MATPQPDRHTPGVPTTTAAITLSVAEAAARVGITASALRSWDRRYGLAPSARTPGGHRRYTSADMLRLREMAELIDSGVSAADAAAATDPGVEPLPQFDQPRASGGGRIVALPDGSAAQRGLARAAMSLDEPAIRTLVTQMLIDHGVVATWSEVLVPVLVAVGDRWNATGAGVEVEHVLAGGIAAALTQMSHPIPTRQRPVLLSCVPEEMHALALLAMQVALQQQGVPTVLLGSRVPTDALHDAIVRLRPRRVVLWAQLPELANPTLLAGLPPLRPAVQLILAGPGWSAEVSHGYDRPSTLADALIMINSDGFR